MTDGIIQEVIRHLRNENLRTKYPCSADTLARKIQQELIERIKELEKQYRTPYYIGTVPVGELIGDNE